MTDPVMGYLLMEHPRLHDLLARAMATPHIAIEEKVLLPAVRRARQGRWPAPQGGFTIAARACRG